MNGKLRMGAERSGGHKIEVGVWKEYLTLRTV